MDVGRALEPPGVSMPKSRRLAAAALLPIALLALAASPVLGALLGTLDQHNNDTTGAVGHFAGVQSAQTFTAGATGRLTYARLYCMGYGEGNTNDVNVELWSVANGKPDAKLATSEASNASSACDSGGTWVDYAFAPTVTVTSGTQYAIVFGGNDAWGMSPSNAYAAGASCENPEGWGCGTLDVPTNDYLFETYVLAAATPTPFVPTEPPTDSLRTAPDSSTGSGVGIVLAVLAVGATIVVLPARRSSRRR